MISVSESKISICQKNVNECINIANNFNETLQEILDSTKEANKLSDEYFRVQTTQPYPGGYTIEHYNSHQNSSSSFLFNEQRKNKELTEHIQKMCVFIEQIAIESRRPPEIQDILNLYR